MPNIHPNDTSVGGVMGIAVVPSYISVPRSYPFSLKGLSNRRDAMEEDEERDRDVRLPNPIGARSSNRDALWSGKCRMDHMLCREIVHSGMTGKQKVKDKSVGLTRTVPGYSAGDYMELACPHGEPTLYISVSGQGKG